MTYVEVSGLNVRVWKLIWYSMNIRVIFATLIALTMSFAPLGAPAMAKATEDHQSQMMTGGHCGDQTPDSKHSKAAGKSCCVAMCAAIAVAPASSPDRLTFSTVAVHPALAVSPHSYLAKLATPPPRRA